MRCGLPETVFIGLPEGCGPGSFSDAKRLAGDDAERRLGPCMLLSWKDLRTGACSPDVEACNDCGLEGWEQYAVSRGAELRVEVGAEYVFMFKKL